MIDKLKVFAIFLFIIFLNISCDKNIKENNTNSSFLPRASGENNEMLIVMDSAKFKAEIGRLLEVSRERVRQVELKALRKLRNLTRKLHSGI